MPTRQCNSNFFFYFSCSVKFVKSWLGPFSCAGSQLFNRKNQERLLQPNFGTWMASWFIGSRGEEYFLNMWLKNYTQLAENFLKSDCFKMRALKKRILKTEQGGSAKYLELNLLLFLYFLFSKVEWFWPYFYFDQDFRRFQSLKVVDKVIVERILRVYV